MRINNKEILVLKKGSGIPAILYAQLTLGLIQQTKEVLTEKLTEMEAKCEIQRKVLTDEMEEKYAMLRLENKEMKNKHETLLEIVGINMLQLQTMNDTNKALFAEIQEMKKCMKDNNEGIKLVTSNQKALHKAIKLVKSNQERDIKLVTSNQTALHSHITDMAYKYGV